MRFLNSKRDIIIIFDFIIIIFVKPKSGAYNKILFQKVGEAPDASFIIIGMSYFGKLLISIVSCKTIKVQLF